VSNMGQATAPPVFHGRFRDVIEAIFCGIVSILLNNSDVCMIKILLTTFIDESFLCRIH